MDPNANLREQREIAARIITDSNFLIRDAERLAELVFALDEWRSNGGFDPYDPNLTPQHRALARLLRDHKPITLHVTTRSFGLPDDYLGFTIGYERGGTLVGGISPEGDVST